MNYKIGDKVKWLGNPYIIMEVTSSGVILKQEFSIGITLKSAVPTKELTLNKS
jgi:hypothetical protein